MSRIESVPSAVRLRDVTIRFGNFVAVQQVNLTIGDGEFVAVVGPTGCGKSTLLNAVTGLLKPAGGEIDVFGETLAGLNSSAGFMMQQDALLPWKSALDNVGMGLVFQGHSKEEARAAARPWMRKVGLAGFEDRFPHQLSGGQRKRISMAQTLILAPKIVLMDEPFSALDVHTRHLMQSELLRLWQEDRKSLLFITHDLEEAIALADRVIVFSAGPAARPVGDVQITLPRPRNISEINMTEEFMSLYRKIWNILGTEVEKSHAAQH
ncbi:ABC transporter ATP-binding protein [Burkholderia pseudomallei]|uniref:ABC transporter ATP-binding protein n=1 Tax=Burkholderia pseudomallei TaxID=28450 RepID=UPI000A1A2D9A|nr:ABC transporter ATP-binding protein [Burkholderia pseudomallei]ARL91327.1 mannosyltransferase [Burkholderia pseudomallei]MBH9657976.1 ABC transporter ATP-binding protein [Burkholderia pseudomallei]NRD83773.1 ABC transporter ATP-binding protein [Burkholderia pseudomallei]